MAGPTTSEQIERQAILVALQKQRSGQTITTQERATLKRFARKREEESRWEHYNKIPQKHWRDMSGRQANQLREQEERYGLPGGGRTVCLPDFIRAVYDFLARKKHILARADDEDLYSAVTSPALERLREETYKLRRLERLQREGQLVDLRLMHEFHSRLGSILRGAGDRLQRRCGNEAFKIYNEALDAIDREIKNFFGEEAPPTGEGASKKKRRTSRA